MSSRPARRSKRKRDQPEPVIFGIADKLKLFGILGGVFLFMAVLINLAATRQQSQGMDKLMLRWQRDYHLSEEQVRRIRVVEEFFHGKNPLFRSGHTTEQITEHHREIARYMNPEDGVRFLKHQNQQSPDDAKH